MVLKIFINVIAKPDIKDELAEVESRTERSRPRLTPRTQKNPRPRTDFLKTDLLEANKDKNLEAKGRGHNFPKLLFPKRKPYCLVKPFLFTEFF